MTAHCATGSLVALEQEGGGGGGGVRKRREVTKQSDLPGRGYSQNL